ncbi:uncharacterized protein DDB_G0271670-like [Panonychus citri]|uniref:uncharacterized protein DDB_G0271670-like n=1 Tax=Panonychus citri TaxID=50023 RepID=UPI0023071F3F|nr:uncharacterized protein DDB_G0271670-like [Panonychus citri]
MNSPKSGESKDDHPTSFVKAVSSSSSKADRNSKDKSKVSTVKSEKACNGIVSSSSSSSPPSSTKTTTTSTSNSKLNNKMNSKSSGDKKEDSDRPDSHEEDEGINLDESSHSNGKKLTFAEVARRSKAKATAASGVEK